MDFSVASMLPEHTVPVVLERGLRKVVLAGFCGAQAIDTGKWRSENGVFHSCRFALKLTCQTLKVCCFCCPHSCFAEFDSPTMQCGRPYFLSLPLVLSFALSLSLCFSLSLSLAVTLGLCGALLAQEIIRCSFFFNLEKRESAREEKGFKNCIIFFLIVQSLCGKAF